MEISICKPAILNLSKGISASISCTSEISNSDDSWTWILDNKHKAVFESSGVVITVMSMSPSDKKVRRGNDPYTVTFTSFFSRAR